MSDLPAPTSSKFFTYWFDINSFGNFRNEVKETETLFLNWAAYMSGNDQLNNSFAAYADEGKHFIFGPNIQQTDTTITANALSSLDIAAPYWASIDYVWLGYLQNITTASAMTTFVNSWKSAVASKGLTPKPVIVGFFMIFQPGPWQATNIDVIANFCYIDPAHQDDANITTVLTTQINTALSLIGTRQVVLVIEASNAQGHLHNITTIRNIQLPPYNVGYNKSNVIGFMFNSYGQDGGTTLDTRFLPQCVRVEHIRMFNASIATDQPPEIACTNAASTVTWFPVTLTCGIITKFLACAIPQTLSGIYKLVPNQHHDTLYSAIYSPTLFTTIDQPIPEPFAVTTLIPSTDS